MDKTWVRDDARLVDKRDEAGKVLAYLRGETSRPPIVMDRHRPYGVVNARRLMGGRIDHRMHIDKMTQPVPVVDRDASPEEVMNAFSESLAPYLPVRGGSRFGKPSYVDAVAVLHAFQDGPRAGQCAQDTPTVSPDDTMGKAARTFSKTHVDHLPVVDNGVIVGRLDRTAVLNCQGDRLRMGRDDHGGDQEGIMDGKVRGYMANDWQTLEPNADYKQMVDVLHWYGYAFIQGPSEAFEGTVTPALAVRALQRARQGVQAATQ